MNEEIAEIVETATKRAKKDGLAFAGILAPVEARALLMGDSNIKLIDVRTQAEHDWIGRVDVLEAQYAEVQWYAYPGNVLNTCFIAELEQVAGRDDILLFLCRAGVRSGRAATLAAENGFLNCFNILHGFEGERGESGHRKTVSGWCYSGLPWIGA